MQFAEIPGYTYEKTKLISLIQLDRMPHALLLNGPEGSAKLALALALISFIQCDHPEKTDACGKCNACQKTKKMIHPDVHFSFPTSGVDTADELLSEWRTAILEQPYLNAQRWQESISKENKLLNIPVKECKNILRKLSYTIYEGKFKILLVWLPEYLGKEGNVLLKLIEEPPPQSLLFFITENPDFILSTIRSRCQMMVIPPFQDEDISIGLKSIGISQEKSINDITKAADGNMLEALLMAKENLLPQTELFIAWLRACYKSDTKNLNKWIDEIATKGRDFHRHFFRYSLRYMRYILSYKISGEEYLLFTDDEKKGIRGLAGQMSIQEINELSRLLNDHIFFVERNAHPKILFSAASLNIKQILNHQKATTFDII